MKRARVGRQRLFPGDVLPQVPSSLPLSRSSHGGWKDVYGLVVASVMIAVGAFLLNAAKITIGGTVGLSLMTARIVALPYPIVSIAISLPLFGFGWRMMGRAFIGKSLAVTAMSAALFAEMPQLAMVTRIEPAFAALVGGTIVGMGALAAARHGAAAGGTLVVVLWLQRRFSVNAGLAQLAVDFIVVLLAAILLGWSVALWSGLGVIATDAMVIAWYRPNADALRVEAPGIP